VIASTLLLLGFVLAAATDGLSNLAMWSLIVGALTPPLLSVVQQPRFARLRPVLMIGAAITDGVVIAWLQGNLDFARFTNSALIAGVAIITAYHGIWKPSGISPAIEKKTS
jgi:hypothetical protein